MLLIIKRRRKEQVVSLICLSYLAFDHHIQYNQLIICYSILI